MFDLKRIWIFVFGFALLALPVIPTGVQADDLVSGTAVCLIGDHPGIPESDAKTSAMLVCDALRTHGIAVSDPVDEAPAAASAYRVILRRLGEKIFVRLSHENPTGTIITERQITLENIEEMIPAAPRLVDALVHNKPIDATVDMEHVTEQEARELRNISDESLWHIGIFGITIPGTDIIAESGFEFGWSYQTPSYAMVTEARLGGGEEEESSDSFSLASLSIGGRYFSNKRNISPYVGGGLSLVAVSIPGEAEGGFGAYGILGIELFHLTKSRLNLELRVDRPFFELPNQDIMPITFGISFSRSFIAK